MTRVPPRLFNHQRRQTRLFLYLTLPAVVVWFKDHRSEPTHLYRSLVSYRITP